ncbi:hypothetical protein HZ326_12847 [Fusarium oxysporum f. sp. albedinis]|nr:hypothetical protein HZ326_12847 [Fusarium oxysporum f. sp. albedinis]
MVVTLEPVPQFSMAASTGDDPTQLTAGLGGRSQRLNPLNLQVATWWVFHDVHVARNEVPKTMHPRHPSHWLLNNLNSL